MTLRVECELDGAGPDLVLIHSLGADRRLWHDVLAALRARFRVLTYDVRGHGGTGGPYGPVTIDLMRDDLRTLLDDLGIERPAVVGLSMGGMIAQAFAAAWPERLEALVLADTASEFDGAIRAAWHERAAVARRDGMAALVEPTLARWFPPVFLAAGGPSIGRLRATLAAQDPEHYAAAAEALAGLQLTERLAEIRTRTLVCTGADDVAIPPRFSTLLCERIAGAGFVSWPGVGHCPPLQDPAAFTRAVLTFLG